MTSIFTLLFSFFFHFIFNCICHFQNDILLKKIIDYLQNQFDLTMSIKSEKNDFYSEVFCFFVIEIINNVFPNKHLYESFLLENRKCFFYDFGNYFSFWRQSEDLLKGIVI